MIRPAFRVALAAGIVLTWMMLNLFLFRLTGLGGSAWRYVFLPPVFLFLALVTGARFVQQVYGLARFRDGLKYFGACVFGFGYPEVVIGDGKAQRLDGTENLLLKIGGPGILRIQAGNVALVEHYGGSMRVLGPGRYLLSRYETIKEFTSLDERFKRIDELTAYSKDGIKVAVRDVSYRYRMANHGTLLQGKGPHSLFEFSEEAVIQMVYNRAISERGAGTWEESVNGVVRSILSDFIRMHPVDYLTAPKAQGADPRAEIKAEFQSPSGQRKFRQKGAALIWIDIGHFETPEELVSRQRVNTWQARLQGSANMERATGEAQRIAYQEMGRAEAQADILMSILDSLESINKPGEARQNMRALYLARIAQMLDALGTEQLLSLPKNHTAAEGGE